LRSLGNKINVKRAALLRRTLFLERPSHKEWLQVPNSEVCSSHYSQHYWIYWKKLAWNKYSQLTCPKHQ
jgi:hypothetical protein